ncbi:digestive cysteine proteinase 2-like [Oncorhynchus kisutch]|uniref:digestive cysteine proteinase 2-like n=1 Tax=Oncorhynchus kisutch TaxID=8019 RepID=UPI0012DC55FE|nr:digestive cysteine proteinase 2-like [Oncorhynchus kisutch]
MAYLSILSWTQIFPCVSTFSLLGFSLSTVSKVYQECSTTQRTSSQLHKGKTYPSTEEEAKRKEIWLASRKMVTEHNKRAENGLESYTLAVNHFADLTTQEVPRGLLPME